MSIDTPIPEEVIAALRVACSAYGLTICCRSPVKLYSHTERPVPKKPKDLARCHMMNQSLHRVICNNLRKPNPAHKFYSIYRVLSYMIERNPTTGVQPEHLP